MEENKALILLCGAIVMVISAMQSYQSGKNKTAMFSCFCSGMVFCNSLQVFLQ